MPSLFEPLAGWIDNINGAIGVMIATGKGILRSLWVDTHLKVEFIPVDYAINGLITIAFEFATAGQKPTEVPVYNLTVSDHLKPSWGEVVDLHRKVRLEYPYESAIWYPYGCVTGNKFIHKSYVLLFQWLPAYLVDFLILLLRRRRLFNMDMDALKSPYEYMVKCYNGGRQYILNEPFDTLPKARKHMKKLYYLDRACRVLLIGLILFCISRVFNLF